MTEYQKSEYLTDEIYKLNTNPRDLLFIISTDKEEAPSLLSYNFDYLGLILELFECFKPEGSFYSVEIKDSTSGTKKIKIDPRNDEFFCEFALEDLPCVGENIYNRVTKWQQKFNEMGFNQGKDNDFLAWFIPFWVFRSYICGNGFL